MWKKSPDKTQVALLWAFGTVLLLLALNFLLIRQPAITMVDFSAFEKLIEGGTIKGVEMAPSAYLGFTVTREQLDALRQKPAQGGIPAGTTPPEKEYQTAPVQDPGFVGFMDSKGVEYCAVVPQSHPLLDFLVPVGSKASE